MLCTAAVPGQMRSNMCLVEKQARRIPWLRAAAEHSTICQLH